MFTIVRGGRAAEVALTLGATDGQRVLRAAGRADAPIPWGALRSFVQMKGGSQPKLESGGGIALGAFPNAALRDGGMYRAWARTFADLFAHDRLRIVVPELEAIDFESLRALRGIVRALRNRAEVIVVIGHDPSIAPVDPIDAFFRARRVEELARIEALSITRVELAPGDASHPAMSVQTQPSSEGLSAVRSAFDSFAFEPTVRLAEAILRGRDLDDPALRDALRYQALALNNLAPFAREPWVAATLVDRFTRLLASESDPLGRSHWAYRLTLVHGRARGAFDEALVTADRAVTESESATNDPRAPIFVAWAHNGRAYVRARLGDLDGAAADTETGYAALSRPTDGVPPIEIALGRMFMCNNRARVAQSAGDAGALAKWRALRYEHMAALPAEEHPGPAWLPVPEGDRDLAAQRDHHAARLATAQDELDSESEAISAHALGVALYKLGDAHGAHDAFATSLRIWTITRGFAEDLLTEELNCAVTAFRSGDTARAEAGFTRLRASPLMQSAGAQAETLAALAMIDGRAGLRDRAVARGEEAVLAADAAGEPDVLVRTLRSAAEARMLLGDREGARTLLTKALATITSVEAVGGDLPAEDVLGVLVSTLDANDTADHRTLHRAISLTAHAVADANAWWDLPRLAKHVRANGDLQRDPSLADGLAALAMVTDQRLTPP